MDNPEADPITLADLADAQCSVWSHRCGDAILLTLGVSAVDSA